MPWEKMRRATDFAGTLYSTAWRRRIGGVRKLQNYRVMGAGIGRPRRIVRRDHGDLTQRRIAMSKGNDKKPKADKSKPKPGVSPYKAAQGTGKPAISPFAKKPGR